MGSKRKRTSATPDTQSQKNPKKKKESDELPEVEVAPFQEELTPAERKREGGLYDRLRSEDENERVAAAQCIISSLLFDGAISEPVLKRHLDRRLFRGLASGRDAARQGFSLVLTEVLSQLFGPQALAQTHCPGLTFESALESLLEKTKAVGNVPGQEERDHYFGQLFGLQSFVRSQAVFLESSRWRTVQDLILKLAVKKAWLRSACGRVLIQGMDHLDKDEVQITLESIDKAGLAMTPEGVAAWLAALARFPDLNVKPWRDPLAKKSLGDLAAVMKESFQDLSAQDDKSGKTKQASWTAQLHFVWDIILSEFSKDDADSQKLSGFWQRVVDDGLFSDGATDGQKFKGFMVFQKMLDALAQQPLKLHCLFTKKFMKCLMNQAAKEDRYLHRAAIKSLKAIETLVAAHSDALVPIVSSLLGKNGAFNFDQLTSTKTMDRLLQHGNVAKEGVLMKIFHQPIPSLVSLDEPKAQQILRTYVEYLSHLFVAILSSELDNKALSVISERKESALNALATVAYSQPEDIPAETLKPQIKELCRSRLETSLAKLTRQLGDADVFCKLVTSIDIGSLVMDEELQTEKDNALKRMQKLLKRGKRSTEREKLNQALAMLHAVAILQLYNEDPDAMELLADLSQLTDRLKKIGKEDAGSSEFLVEILLSMVARPSSLMRQVSTQVFDAFTRQITAEGLILLTEPLAAGENTKGQEELFNTGDGEMEIDEDDLEVVDVEDASDFEIGSGIQFTDVNGANVDGSDDDDEGDDDDEEDSDEDSDDDDESDESDENAEDKPQTTANAKNLADLDDALGNLLNSHRLDKDGEAESSDSDGDMTDSEMMALDEKLAEVVQRSKAQSGSKKQKKDAKQTVLNFKNRILDLLDIYVKNEASNPLAFSILTPLLQLMRTTSAKALSNRAYETILKYQKNLKKTRSSKEERSEPLDHDNLLTLLAEVHEEAGKDESRAHAKAASAASLIVASSMFAVDRQLVKQIAVLYAQTSSSWALGEAKLQSSFFADFTNWLQNHAAHAQHSSKS